MNKILRKPTFVSAALICAMMVGCSSEEQAGQDETAIVVPTYYGSQGHPRYTLRDVPPAQ